MRQLLCTLAAVAALFIWNNAAAEIHRCEDADGGIVFQQTPCPEPEPEPAASAETAASTEEDAASMPLQGRPRLREGDNVAAVIEAEQELERESAAVEACKQQYRDAIDAIDLEIQNSYTDDQREYYLAQLTALTEKMRAC